MRKAISLSILFILISWSGWIEAEDSAPAWGEYDFSLEVTDVREGLVYYRLGISKNTPFSIEFLHSYDRVPYWDEYIVDGRGKLIHCRSGGHSMLNGQGFHYKGFRIVPGGTWVIDGIEESMDALFFIMGTRGDADHRLKLPDRTITLSDKIESGRIVRIAAQPRNRHKEGR